MNVANPIFFIEISFQNMFGCCRLMAL